MNYKNGKEVLPPSLLLELQKYIQGELVYIPKKRNERAGWGEISGSRRMIQQRNEEIWISYTKGWSMAELEQKYHLSCESIRKIIMKTRADREKGQENGNPTSASRHHPSSIGRRNMVSRKDGFDE